jgi:hypothetical protein
MSVERCARCPLARHNRPCPAEWPGCAGACELVALDRFRHETVAAAAAGCAPRPDQVEAFAGLVAGELDRLTVRLEHTPRVPSTELELVVAAYREPLGWLESVPCAITVYSKGGMRLEGVPWRPLPNRGREAQTYLRHIVDRYDSLPDFTAFAQGGALEHAPDLVARLELRPDRAVSLAPRYKPDFPLPAVTAHDLVERLGGFELRYGDARFYGGHTFPVGRDPWLRRAWRAAFAGPQPDPWYYGYGACWLVPRAAIRARPLDYWRYLLAKLEGPAGAARAPWDKWRVHPLSAWALEALWLYLFSDPERYRGTAGASAEAAAQGEAARAQLERMRAVRKCPDWSRGEGCGCSGGFCAKGNGKDGRVTFEECFQCLGI